MANLFSAFKIPQWDAKRPVYKELISKSDLSHFLLPDYKMGVSLIHAEHLTVMELHTFIHVPPECWALKYGIWLKAIQCIFFPFREKKVAASL